MEQQFYILQIVTQQGLKLNFVFQADPKLIDDLYRYKLTMGYSQSTILSQNGQEIRL